MSTRILNAALITALSAVLAAPALAHHSFAMYDMQQTKNYSGKLIRYVPGPNHAQLVFAQLDNEGKEVVQNGKPVVWTLETGSAASLSRQGVTVASFPVGTIITVDLHPLRDGRNGGALAGVLIKCGNAMPKGGCNKATGQTFLTGSSQ